MVRSGREPLQLEGRRVLVMGLGTHQGGVGVTRYLVRRGADVTVTDLRRSDELQPALDALRGVPVRFRLGEHRQDDFDAAELIVRNPGVPRESPWLVHARDRGTPIEMEMSLFFRECPAPIIGVTGTKGKTTTATLTARILAQMRPDAVLAGNMGTSALEQLDRISADTPVVIELSSWQLEGLADYEMSPDVAVLTNISEDHLNRYDSMDEYIEAKRHIARYQLPENWFIVNRNEQATWESRNVSKARTVPFGTLEQDEDGAGLEEGTLFWQWEGQHTPLARASELPLPGEHTVYNALAASAAALLAGASADDVRSGLLSAETVPHRLELVATVNGIDYVNDTTATAPAAAIAALQAFADRSIVLIAGGASKGATLDRFAEIAAQKASGIVLLAGDETPRLQRLLQNGGVSRLSEPITSMDEAVRIASDWAEPGGVVLLSPACASFGLFRDEFDRGEQFRQSVLNLARSAAGGAV